MGAARSMKLAAGPGVYLVLSEPRVPHSALAAAAVELGVAAIQLREKRLPHGDLLDLAKELRAITRGSRTLFIVNDEIDVAVASGADGVHLGQSDAPPSRARAAAQGGFLVGVSATSVTEAREAASAGADYVGVGPVFATVTKPDAAPPIGLGGLREVSAAVPDLPTVAIGGIDAENAAAVIRAGASLVAVISCVCHAEDPEAALERLVREVRASAGGPSEDGHA